MQRVSSKATFFYKRIFPIMFFAILLLVTVAPLLAGSRSGQFPPLQFFIIPAIMAVFAYFVMGKLVFDLVDEVWDDGDAYGRTQGIHGRPDCTVRHQERELLGADVSPARDAVAATAKQFWTQRNVLRAPTVHPVLDEPNY